MLKQAFKQDKELQKEVVPLFNAYNNRFDNLIDSFNKEDVISYEQTRNTTSPQLLDTRWNRVVGYFEIEKGATRRNGIVKYFEKKEEIEDVNGDMFS